MISKLFKGKCHAVGIRMLDAHHRLRNN